jgi:hypothetical protein
MVNAGVNSVAIPEPPIAALAVIGFCLAIAGNRRRAPQK